jgi:cytoskeleton-associated protein 5
MDSTVRDSSAEALGTAMKVVSEKTITPFIQGVEAIKLNKIKEFCDKAQVKTPSTAVVPSVPSKPPAVKRIVPNVAKTSSQESLDGSNEELDKETKPPVKKTVLTKGAADKSKNSVTTKPQTNGSSNNISSNSEQLPNSQTALNNNKSKFLVKNKNSRQTIGAPNKTTKKTEEIVSNSPLMPLNKLKDQRMADEKALKVLKWNFTAPREEFYVQLKEQMINADWQMNLINFCFHYDFKNHIKAIDLMKEFLSNGNVEATFANCDLILKWIALRFFDTNPSVILKALEYLLLIFDAYQSNNNTLSDAEANSFIPYLVLKSGDPKDAVRNKVHDIISKLREIYAPSKIFNHLMTGLQSKNSRQRATCLDELANLIELCGMIVCQSNVSLTMKEIAKFIADRDNGVRNAALNCVVQVYFIEGEKVYKHVGQLSDKESSLLEERIKRASKTRLPLVPPQSAPAAVNTSKAAVVPEKNDRTRTPSPQNTRTITKSVASAKSARQRPKSMGPLSLDLEQIEQQLGTNTKRRTPPKNMMINHRPKEIYVDDNDIDIDEILNLPDVQIRKSIIQPSLGPMTKMINSSPKADVALNLVMAQLSSQEISSAMEALSQLSQLLDNEAKAEAVLESKVDQLIIMCYMQYRLFLTKHLADQSLPKTEVINLFRGVTNVLMSLFSKPSLGKKASRDVLRELMSHMVALLVDSKLVELSDSANIIRSVNVLATTVINGSDPTNMLSALIKLLHDCISNSINASPKFMEMIMKCLWKMSRNLDNYIEDIEIDRIFLEVHLFLKSFPSNYSLIFLLKQNLYLIYF